MKRLFSETRVEDLLERIRALPPDDADLPPEAAELGYCRRCDGARYIQKSHGPDASVVECSCVWTMADARQRDRLMRESGVDLPGYQAMRFSSFDLHRPGTNEQDRVLLREAFLFAKKYAEAPQGNLILLGGVGAGKTHLAVAVANRLIERRKRVIFRTVPQILNHLRSTFRPDSPIDYDEMMERWLTTPVLVLDDLGVQSATPWAEEKLFELVNTRIEARLPIVATSNQPQKMGARVLDRIVDKHRGQVFKMDVSSYRRQPPRRDP